MRLPCWARPIVLATTCAALTAAASAAQEPLGITSPNGRNEVTVEVRDGRLFYSVQRDGRALLLPRDHPARPARPPLAIARGWPP
jgi:hypothetical protein